MVLFRNMVPGVLFPERFQDHTNLGRSQIPSTKASKLEVGLIFSALFRSA